jgi:hypothetical protein
MRLNQLVLIVMCLPFVAQAQVYKWVDEKGVTHYGTTPPTNAKARELQLSDPTAGATDKPRAASPSVAEEEAAFRQRQIQRAQRAETEAKEAQNLAQHRARCYSLGSSTAAMRAARRVYTFNEQGERVLLTNAERAALIAEREADYRRSC